MQVLLREVRAGPDGIAEVRDAEAVVDVVSIGSASNQTVQLFGNGVSARHAVIRRAGGRVLLAATRGNSVRINGRDGRGSALATGDVVEIAGHRITLAENQPGFELTLEIRRNDAVSDSEFEGAFRTDLQHTWLSKRSTAWLLAFVMLLLGLAIPLASIHMKSATRQSISRWVPTDAAWTSGPLSPAHEQAIGQDCKACHQALFVAVPDKACRKCHEPLADHISAAHLALTTFQSQDSCESCHREHGEPMSDLVIREDRLCVSCHGEPAARFGKLRHEPVTDFAKTSHPEFRASLLVPPAPDEGTSEWTVAIQRLDSAVERSNLKFSHVQHLDVSRVRSNATGEAMGCAECHTLSADSEHFVKITMAKDCAACHELTFDSASPTRQLPHGKPLEVALTLQEYFNRKYTDPAAATRMRDRRRLPGSETSAVECIDPPLSCARKRAADEIVNQFSRVGCVSCHVVQDTHGPAVEDRYLVTPVRLAYDYFPTARFNHRKHSIQKDLTGDSACLSCHTAKSSRTSGDVLMPDIGTCTECHGGPGSHRQIQSPCISCHLYHPLPVDQIRVQVTRQ